MPRFSLLRRLATPLVRNLQRRCPGMLVLHTGDHKTGSTSIQTAFAQGLKIKGKKVLYPGTMSHNGFAISLKAIDRQNRKGNPEPKHQKTVEAFGARISLSPARYKLLSAEGLEGVSPSTLAQVLGEHFNGNDTIRIVSYVRPHASRLLSNYTEQVKIGRVDGTLEDYLAHVIRTGRLDYMPRFSAWRQEFGSAFHLRPFLRSELKNGSILEDFAQTAFGNSLDVTPDLPPANSSLCIEDLMRLKVLQARQRNRSQLMRHALGWEFARQIAQLPPPPNRTPLRLSRAFAEAVHAHYREDAHAMDQSFFGKRPLMLQALEQAVDESPVETISTDPRDYFDNDEIRGLELMSDMVTSLLDTPDVDWARHLREQRMDQNSKTGAKTGPAKSPRKTPKKRRKARGQSQAPVQAGENRQKSRLGHSASGKSARLRKAGKGSNKELNT